MAAFFLSLGYLSVVFLVTMYLQGIRALSPLDAALLLTPGYVVGSLLSPAMGRFSDRYGARVLASSGAILLCLATLVYLLLRIDTPLWVVLVASGISGIGSAMFFPANNSAVMANAPMGSFGGISGVLRTVQNIGILGSFVIAITVASASVPRSVAFEVFIGTTTLWAEYQKHSSTVSMLRSGHPSPSWGLLQSCPGCGDTRTVNQNRSPSPSSGMKVLASHTP